MKGLPFGFDRPQESPGFLLWQTTTLWQRLLKKELARERLTHPQFVLMALLLWLGEQGLDTTQTLLCTWSKLDKMTVSKALKNLEGQGLVVRQTHAQDTRAVSVRITLEGRTLLHKVIPVIEALDTAFFAPLDASDQNVLKGHFKSILSHQEET